jgi:capsular polysaccharide biosynthesis protein
MCIPPRVFNRSTGHAFTEVAQVRRLRYTAMLDDVSQSTASLAKEISEAQEELKTLNARLRDARERSDQLFAAYRTDLRERAAISGFPRGRLLSDAMVLDGPPSLRLRVRRVTAGERVERSLGQWSGVMESSAALPDVRALWDRLLALEIAGDGMLRGFPCTILDMRDASVTHDESSGLRIALGDDSGAGMVAVPRFTYAFPARKLRNFGHWLLDCLPQIVAMTTVAPDAAFLLPVPVRPFQVATLSMVGVKEHQIVPWDGSRLSAARLLVLESDGRAGGGRPISSLVETRRRIAPAASSLEPRTRRVYVSRRDAKSNRRWFSNEPAVEALFASRGFEILVMADCPLDAQVKIFSEAAIVAGISGAGLSDIVFSAPGTHVIVLLSDSLIRWYAADTGARSVWATADPEAEGEAAAFGDSPRFYAHLAAACEQVCHSFLGPEEAPVDGLAAFLDEVLKQVDHQ